MREGYGTQLKKAVLLALPLVGVLYLVSLWVPHHETVKVSDAKPGDCVDAPATAVSSSMRKHDCKDAHTAEVYAVFPYPGQPAAGMPSPQENCHLAPSGQTAAEQAYFARLLTVIAQPGVTERVVTNQADVAKDRDYVCLVTFPARKGSFLTDALVTG